MSATQKGSLSPQRQRFLDIFTRDIRGDRQKGLAYTADEVRREIEREKRFLLGLTDEEFAEHEEEYFRIRSESRDL